MIQDITQEERIGFVNNFLNIAWGELLHTLTAYTKTEIREDVLSDNEYHEPEHYVVRLRVPETFPVHSVDVLTSTRRFLSTRLSGIFLYRSERGCRDVLDDGGGLFAESEKIS